MPAVGDAPSNCKGKIMPAKNTTNGTAAALGETVIPADIAGIVETSMSSFNKLGDHVRLNLQAGFASANAAASGVRAVGSHAFAVSKALLEVQMSTARQATSARSVQDLLNLQASFAKSLLETYSAQAAKGSETLKAAAGEAWAPLGERVDVALKSLQSVDG